MASRRQVDSLRRKRLDCLLMAERDSFPVATTLAIQVSLEVGRLMARLGHSWRSVEVSHSALARCLKGENVKLASVERVAAALGCDAVLSFVPRWPASAAAASDSTPLFLSIDEAHAVRTHIVAAENSE